MADLEDVTILLVEDDPGHAQLIEKNLRRAGITNAIVKLADGQKCVDFLFKKGEYSGDDHRPPLLILLDLNLPVLLGYQVLAAIKGDARTRAIPVVILTTTDNPQDISRCYELGCNAYMTKPVDYEQFSEVIRKLALFLAIAKVSAKKS